MRRVLWALSMPPERGDPQDPMTKAVQLTEGDTLTPVTFVAPGMIEPVPALY